MMWGYYGNDYGFWPFSIIGHLIGILILILAVVFLIRLLRWGFRGGSWGGWSSGSAEDTLRDRYAKGEISREEYEERMSVLRGEARKK